MALGTFTPPRQPSLGTAESRAPRVNRADFGDGYSLRAPDGLNSDLQTWDLTWNGLLNEERAEIIAFLAARRGTEAFWWTPPGETTAIKVTCKQWKRTQLTGDADSMTAQFKQEADLDL